MHPEVILRQRLALLVSAAHQCMKHLSKLSHPCPTMGMCHTRQPLHCQCGSAWHAGCIKGKALNSKLLE
jgi:hypothetical protein